MNTLTVSIPDSLHKQIQKLADREGISVEQLAASALNEKIAALMSTQYLAQRAQPGNRSKFEQAMGKVANRQADPNDSF